jgi:hypothetical protein
MPCRLKVLRAVLPQVRERAAFVSTSSAGSCRPYIHATTAAKRRCSRFNCLFPALQPADPGRPRCIGNGMTAPARLPRPSFLLTYWGRQWRRGWDSNPRYACTHNGFRDRPDRPLWHPSEGELIGGGIAPGNTLAVSAKRSPLYLFLDPVSGIDSGGSLRIFRALFGGSYGPPWFFVLSSILGVEVIYPLGVVVSVPAPEGLLQVAS